MLVPGPQSEQQPTPALGSPIHRQMDTGRAEKCRSWERTWAEECRKRCDTSPPSALLPPACSCPSSPLSALCQQLKLPWCQQSIETYLGVWQSLVSSALGQHCARAGQHCRAPAPALAPQHCWGARAGLPFPIRLLQAAMQMGCTCLACYMCLPCHGHRVMGPTCHSLQSCVSEVTVYQWPVHVQVPWCWCMLCVDCITCT